jgi:hypothetical protein
MTELEMIPQVETEDFSDDLCDEALDRGERAWTCCGTYFADS